MSKKYVGIVALFSSPFFILLAALIPQQAFAAAAPLVGGLSTSAITQTTVTLHATTTVDASASTTIEGFNYGTTLSYGNVASSTGVFGSGSFTQAITGLTCNTLYHYQGYATNPTGTGTSSDATFTSSACVASVTAQAASGLTGTGVNAILNGTITADGGASSTMRGFAWGATSAYGASTTEAGTFGVGSFNVTLGSLTCNTTYHYAPYAVNSSGTSTYPTDTTFTTNTCPIIVGGGSAVGTWSASSVVQTPANQNNTVVSTPNQAQPPMPTTPVQTPPTSGQNLTIMASQSLIIGDNSNNVLLLQQYLNKNGYTVATTGPGSSGNETTKFGSLTKSALMKFQKANHLPVTGFFGPKTRALIMSW